jgi:hypothetical protein
MEVAAHLTHCHFVGIQQFRQLLQLGGGHAVQSPENVLHPELRVERDGADQVSDGDGARGGRHVRRPRMHQMGRL